MWSENEWEIAENVFFFVEVAIVQSLLRFSGYFNPPIWGRNRLHIQQSNLKSGLFVPDLPFLRPAKRLPH